MIVSCPLIKVFVRERYLYDMDETKEGFIRGKIIGVSSYEGHQLTFQVLLENGAVFSYLPLEAFSEYEQETEITNRTFNICKKGKIDVFELDYLKNEHVALFNNNGVYENIVGIYEFSIDWIDENQQLHLISSGGEFFLRPNHKMLIIEGIDKLQDYKKLPDYKKLHREWKEPKKP